MDLKERLVAIRRHLQMTQEELSTHLGLGPKTWGKVEKGRNEPSFDTLKRLHDRGFNLNWIAAEHGSMLLEDGHFHFNDGPPIARTFRGRMPDDLARAGFVLVPRYDIAAAAGTGAVVDAEEELQSIAFKREWLHRTLGANPADLLVMEARGESAHPKLKDGDLMLLNCAEPKLRSGKAIYVFSYDGLLFVKNLEKRLDGGLLVTSENADLFPPEIIPADRVGEVKIIGRLIWSAGRV